MFPLFREIPGLQISRIPGAEFTSATNTVSTLSRRWTNDSGVPSGPRPATPARRAKYDVQAFLRHAWVVRNEA